MFDLDTNGRIPAPAQPGSKTQGSVAVLDLVADKWTMRVVYTLKNGSRHYGEILRTIEGISKKMLTQTLRDLERNGFVTRTVHPTNPPTVEYTLTPLGQTLLQAIVTLCDWAKAHYPEVEAAQARYDAKQVLN